jgi:hypothetical protein
MNVSVDVIGGAIGVIVRSADPFTKVNIVVVVLWFNPTIFRVPSTTLELVTITSPWLAALLKNCAVNTVTDGLNVRAR